MSPQSRASGSSGMDGWVWDWGEGVDDVGGSYAVNADTSVLTAL